MVTKSLLNEKKKYGYLRSKIEANQQSLHRTLKLIA